MYEIFRTFLEIHPDLSVTIYDEDLSPLNLSNLLRSKMRNHRRGKVTDKTNGSTWEIEVFFEGNDQALQRMTVHQIKSGELICLLMATDPWNSAPPLLFEPA